MMEVNGGVPHRTVQSRAVEVFLVFLKLGLTSFGGPVAHLGYFREEFVARRKWLDEPSYVDVIALCQFLPGPASSQVGLAIGLSRAGYLGALAAWTGFTLPSAIALMLFAYGVEAIGGVATSAWVHGLKIAAVAVVALAVLGMMRSLAPDRQRATLAVAAACIVLVVPTSLGQISSIALGGLAGVAFLREGGATKPAFSIPLTVTRLHGTIALLLFFGLLIALPLAASTGGSPPLQLFDSFYRTGSLVFGGGHVVLPLLQAEVVPRGWVTNDAFLAGYGAAQAVPGPLFTFSTYLGTVIGGWLMGVLCLVAVFLPSFLLVIGAMPFWESLRKGTMAQAALKGVNAAVVGLLVAALYHPVWTSGITSAKDFALAAVAFLLLFMWQTPPWLVVVLSAGAAGALAQF
jgi:chromate transporter